MRNSQKSFQNFTGPMGLWFHLETRESRGGMRERKADVFPIANTGFDQKKVMRLQSQSLTRAVMCHFKKWKGEE